MSTVRVILVLAVLLVTGAVIMGFATVTVPAGLTSTASCGSPWFPNVSSSLTADQCSAATLPLAIMATMLFGVGLIALLLVGLRQAHDGAGRIYLGPRRNPKRDND